MKLILLFFLLLIGIPKTALAQKDEQKILVIGSVIDSFTGRGLGNASITIYNAKDSVVSKPWLLTFSNRERNGNEFREAFPRQKGRYRIHVECKNYKPTDYWFEISRTMRKTELTIPPIAMQKDFRLNNTDDDATELKEVVVKATKIKMYHRGDTIVYNADAFNLPEGSMLDDLIRQLPGARLTDKGEIFINGRKIDMLMLNGKDFFSHNKKIALENLPYYIVKEIKVYDESTDRSKALGHEVDAKLHVMDVRLKKEYSIGYLGNAEVGAGTQETWLARLFALRFSDNSRISLFYNGNDINESRKPDAGGNINMKLDEAGSGLQTQHTGGADIRVDDKLGRWTESGNITYSWKKDDTESRSTSQTFLPGGNTFMQYNNMSTNKNGSLNADNTFQLKKPFFLELHSKVNVRNHDRWSEMSGISLDNMRDTVNSNSDLVDGHGKKVDLAQSLRFLRNLPSGDDVELDASASYRHETNDENSHYVLQYNNGQTGQHRNRYNKLPADGYDFTAGALYRINLLNEMSIALDYRFEHHNEDKNEVRMLLETIVDDSSMPLPSMMDGALQGLDAQNSYRAENSQFAHRVGLNFTKRFGVKLGQVDKNYKRLSFNLPLTYQTDNYHYDSEDFQKTQRRSLWLVQPSLELNWNYKFSGNLSMNVKPADMGMIIPYQRNYNPLAIHIGNPDLSSQKNYYLNLNYSPSIGGWGLWISCNGSIYQDRIANSVSYDKGTGAYTYRPVNVKGNWQTRHYLEAGRHLDKNRRFHLSNLIQVQYDHQVDMLCVGESSAEESTVGTTTLGDDLKLSFSKGKLTTEIEAKYNFIHMQGEAKSFESINAHDIRYGGRANYTFPFKLSVISSLYMYSRRGFTDSRMNTDDLLWNISLGYPFLKGKLVAHLESFDLLHQLNNITYTVNGQGRTETWNRSIPNYFMMRLQWKFNKNPKKKKQG